MLSELVLYFFSFVCFAFRVSDLEFGIWSFGFVSLFGFWGFVFGFCCFFVFLLSVVLPFMVFCCFPKCEVD